MPEPKGVDNAKPTDAEGLFSDILDADSENVTDDQDTAANVTEDGGNEPRESDTGADTPTDSDNDVEAIDVEQMDLDQPLVYKEQEMTLRELLDSGLRQSDYTRKTQELSSNRKELEAELASVREERGKYGELLGKLETAIEEAVPKVDWEALRQEDPVEFAARRADFSIAQEKLDKVRAEKARVAELEQADAAKKMEAYLANQREKLFEAIPEWADAEKAAAGQRALMDYGQSVGFSSAELELVADHRAVLLLRKAMLYDQLQGSKQIVRKKAKGAPVLKPGVQKRPKREQNKVTRAREQLRKSGRVQDAASLFLSGLEAGEPSP